MTNDSATSAYGAFSQTLDMIERWRHSPSPLVSTADRARLKGMADRFGDELAKAIFVYWVDETIIEAGLPCSRQWAQQTLEFEIYRTQNKAHFFFERAQQASAQGKLSALTMAFLAVALGFRGIYRRGAAVAINMDTPDPAPAPIAQGQAPGPAPAPQPDPDLLALFDKTGIRPNQGGLFGPGPGAGMVAGGMGAGAYPPPAPPPPVSKPGAVLRGLPATLEDWLRGTMRQIGQTPGKYQPSSHPDSAGDCRPLRASFALRFWVRAFVASAVCTAVLVLGVLFKR